MPMIKVLVADDHPVFRQGLAALLQQYAEFDVVGQAANGNEAVAKAKQSQPDVVIMDIYMPGGNGVAATADLQRVLPQTRVIMFTVSDRDDDLFEAIKAGAKGYLLKSVDLDELVDSIRLVAEGEAIISPAMAVRLLEEFKQGKERAGKDPAELSRREGEVLQLVAEGTSTKQIADILYIGETTVKSHLRSIMQKLHARNRAEAVALAANKGLLNR
jgi:two-component system NarL family response regulator